MGKFFKTGQNTALKEGIYQFKEMEPSPDGPVDKRTKELIPFEQMPRILQQKLMLEGLPTKLAKELTPEEKQKLFNQAIVSRFAVDAASDDFARPHLKRYEKVKDLPLIGPTINKGIEWFINHSKKKYPKTKTAIDSLIEESPHTKKLTNKDLRKIVERIADHTTKYNFDVKKLQSINEADSTRAADANASPHTVYKSWK